MRSPWRGLTNGWIVPVTVCAIGVGLFRSRLPGPAAIPISESRSLAGRDWAPRSLPIRGGWVPWGIHASGTGGATGGEVRDLGPGSLAVAQGTRGGAPFVTPPSEDLRRELPPEPVPGPEPDPTSEPEIYRVRSGDRYWTIAARVLGDGKRWRELRDLNPDVPPHRLREGMDLRLPSSRVAGGRVGDGARSHRVRDGENLSAIAVMFYTDGNWRRIYRANRAHLRDPDRVPAGTLLVIPPAPGHERARP